MTTNSGACVDQMRRCGGARRRLRLANPTLGRVGRAYWSGSTSVELKASGLLSSAGLTRTACGSIAGA